MEKDERITQGEKEKKILRGALEIFERREITKYKPQIRREFNRLIDDISWEIQCIENPNLKKIYEEMGGKVQI
jgi:hypothetical protein